MSALYIIYTLVLCSLLVPSTFSIALHTQQQQQHPPPGPYPVHYTGASVIEAATACDQLRTSIPDILAARRHEPMQVTNAIASLYLEGENPSTTELFDGIPDEVKQPVENMEGAISSDGEWDRADVIADKGYGEANDVQIVDGGLPSFCRFGASIVTSDRSSVWFETWMPLPSNSTTTGAMPSAPYNMTAPSARSVIQAALQARQGNRRTDGAASRDGWRGRLIFVGNAAQKGSVNYPEMKQVLTRYREATASTNGGHFGSGSQTNWTIGNVESQIDFGHRAVHLSSLASQAVVKEFFGVKDRRTSKGKHRIGFPSYFKGCSTGGRQGFGEAQRYPSDFDGILAGSPAIFYNELNAYQIHVNFLQSNTSSPRYIPRSLYSVIHAHIIEQCDLNDGVRDAVLQDPSTCKPKLHELLCPTDGNTASEVVSSTTDAPSSSSSIVSNAASPTSDGTAMATGTSVAASKKRASKKKKKEKAAAVNCLTSDQLDNLQDIYRPLRYPDGRIIHEPVLYGSETVWTVTDGVVGTPFPPAPGWYQYQVLNRTDGVDAFDPYTQVEGNFSLIQLGHDLDPGGTNTDSTNLSDYFATGSKIIHYHGLADQLIPSGASDRYHRLVKETTQLDAPLSAYYRYFHIPGMGHCRGGDGAWNFGGAGQSDTAGERPLVYNARHDALLALFEWVEYASAPEYIVGAAYKNATEEAPSHIGNSTNVRPYANGVKYTHKMCPFPKQAVLINPSDPYSAASLECQHPAA